MQVSEEVLDRGRGCLLGQVIGDALGSIVEFKSAARIRELFPQGVRELVPSPVWRTCAGQPTDDSELALALARTLAEEGEWKEGAAMGAYRRWLSSGPFDVGNTTMQALAHGSANAESQANGSLMRCSPLGIFGWRDPQAASELARKDSALTHPNPVCRDACGVYVGAVARAISGMAKAEIYGRALDEARTDGVRRALEEARGGAPRDFLSQQGWVLVAIQNAFFRFLRSASFEEGLIDTVGEGGDTDTNGAIAGALLGAHHGRKRIPGRWEAVVLECRPESGRAEVRVARPREYWPCDVPELAERLLRGGGRVK
jgi:ADP-ribosylglycohydrolase